MRPARRSSTRSRRGSRSRSGTRCRTEQLLDAAAAGKLGTREQVAKQAERMLADPRAKAKLREFLLTWLKLDHAEGPGQGPEALPRLRRGARRRPADVARTLPRRRRLERPLRLPATAPRRTTSVPQRPAAPQCSTACWSTERGRSRHAVHEGEARSRPAGRRADAPVPAGGARLHERELADPSRRVRRPRPARHPAPAAAGGRSRRSPPTCTRT